jgi:hypothetical protein
MVGTIGMPGQNSAVSLVIAPMISACSAEGALITPLEVCVTLI